MRALEIKINTRNKFNGKMTSFSSSFFVLAVNSTADINHLKRYDFCRVETIKKKKKKNLFCNSIRG